MISDQPSDQYPQLYGGCALTCVGSDWLPAVCWAACCLAVRLSAAWCLTLPLHHHHHPAVAPVLLLHLQTPSHPQAEQPIGRQHCHISPAEQPTRRLQSQSAGPPPSHLTNFTLLHFSLVSLSHQSHFSPLSPESRCRLGKDQPAVVCFVYYLIMN